jgi:hypothetical protein
VRRAQKGSGRRREGEQCKRDGRGGGERREERTEREERVERGKREGKEREGGRREEGGGGA